ncbi:MAG: hypothetical protein ACKVW3_03270 [Phycisphaerales bacterium]
MNENQMKNPPARPDADANQDPITGTIGAHPVGTGLGAIGVGAAAGAVGGAVAGPIGAAAGAVVGAVAGGLAGKATAEAINPTVESKYWRDSHPSRPYAHAEFGYEEYAPAYRYGWESFGSQGGQGRTFESMEADLSRGWERAKGSSRLSWDQAKVASREAWTRVQSAAPSRNARS